MQSAEIKEHRMVGDDHTDQQTEENSIATYTS